MRDSFRSRIPRLIVVLACVTIPLVASADDTQLTKDQISVCG